MTAEAIPAVIFVPLLAALAAVVLPARGGRVVALLAGLGTLALLYPLTLHVLRVGALDYSLAGFDAPLGIRLRVDGFSVLLLGLTAVVMFAAAVHATVSIGADAAARRFWPAWLVLAAGLHALFLSGDLFNTYVGLELMTLGAVALVASRGSSEALGAALRYLLLAMLGSLIYLCGVALVYSATGALDLALVRERFSGVSSGDVKQAAPLILMAGGLLLKSAVFPLHGWLPAAHASAPGPVSAVLSALVVKASLYVLYRLWFEVLPLPHHASAGTFMASLGAAAVLFGSVMALQQKRLKRLVAYSTVAQLGYLMLPFDLPVVAAWQGAACQMVSHGLAKGAMFLAAANLVQRLGADSLDRLPGADQAMPVSCFAFALAGVSLMGLPPSGGFIAKWLLLEAAWQLGAWHWVVLVLLGSLLAAAYLFRVLGLMYTRPAVDLGETTGTFPGSASNVAALVLGALAIVAGFGFAPVLELLPVPTSLAAGAP